MDELEEEENSPSISTMSNLACKKSLPKHDEQPTHNSTEISSSKGIKELMVKINELRLNWELNHITSTYMH